jgi:hypothetical protein
LQAEIDGAAEENADDILPDSGSCFAVIGGTTGSVTF